MSRQKARFLRGEMRRLMQNARRRAKSYWEVGGLLIDNGHFLQIRETRNISKRECSFQLDMREVNAVRKAAAKLGLKVVGTFHSHIFSSPAPGASDIRGAEEDALMLIIDSMDRQIGLWRISHGRAYTRRFELI